MNNTLFENFLLFLADNLDAILIGIGVLFVLLLIVSLIPSKKKKSISIKGDVNLDKTRASLDQAAANMQGLLQGYQGQIEQIEEEVALRQTKIQELDEEIAKRNQEIQMLDENAGDLQQTIAQISERSAQEATKKAKGGRTRMFFIGLLIGVALCLGAIAAYQHWDFLKSLIPAEWFEVFEDR